MGTEKTADKGRIKTRDKEFRNVEYLKEVSSLHFSKQLSVVLGYGKGSMTQKLKGLEATELHFVVISHFEFFTFALCINLISPSRFLAPKRRPDFAISI